MVNPGVKETNFIKIMTFALIFKSRNEQIIIGYSFFVLFLKPVTTLSGKLVYYRVIKKMKIVKLLRIKGAKRCEKRIYNSFKRF